ncbi:hypothetical protein D3C86_1068790 [compost metagenome]
MRAPVRKSPTLEGDFKPATVRKLEVSAPLPMATSGFNPTSKRICPSGVRLAAAPPRPVEPATETLAELFPLRAATTSSSVASVLLIVKVAPPTVKVPAVMAVELKGLSSESLSEPTSTAVPRPTELPTVVAVASWLTLMR